MQFPVKMFDSRGRRCVLWGLIDLRTFFKKCSMPAVEQAWQSTGRDRLLRKLARLYLPAESSTFRVVGDGSPGSAARIFADWHLTLGRAEVVVACHPDSGDLVRLLSEPACRCVLIDQGDVVRARTVELVANLRRQGFERLILVPYGLVARLLHHGMLFDWIRATAAARAVLSLCMSVERWFLPHLTLISGGSVAMVALRPEPAPAPVDPTLDLSIVVPAYNEEHRLAPHVRLIGEYLERTATRAEVIVVDDGSTDGTVPQLSAAAPGLRLLRLHRNLGKGAAVRAGVMASRAPYVLVTDADGATPIEEVEKLSRALGPGVGGSIASRYLAGFAPPTRASALRRVVSRVGNLLIRVIALLPYRDTQCGFKLWRRSVALELFGDLLTRGFGFDFELLWRARLRGVSVAEVPVAWRAVGASKVGPMDTARTFLELLRLRFGRVLRFSMVGVVNTIVDYAVHNALVLALGVGGSLRQTGYQAAGFLCANLLSYLFHTGFTFRSRGSYVRFFSVSISTLSLSLVAYYWLHSALNPAGDLLISNALKLVTVLISVLVNYVGYSQLVYREKFTDLPRGS